MYLTAEVKQQIFKDKGFNKSETDTGSPESQVALFTHRINHLTEHLKINKKDHDTKLSLLKLVGKRRRFLNYLQKVDLNRYRSIIAVLNIRK
jgi:small subunit ribosomal protein S15